MPKTEKIRVPINEGDLYGDLEVDFSVQCLNCKNLLSKIPITCKAFRDGIELDILSGKFDHTKKHPKQDNNILFEPISKKEK